MREKALSLVGQVCHEVFHSENKIKDRDKVVYKRTSVKALLSVLSASIPSSEFLFHIFHCSLRRFLSLQLSCSLSTFFSCSPLSAAVTDFFLTRLKYEYFKAKKLKGNNEMAPKLNYTPFPESQKRDFSE